jgi:putative transposase
MLATRFPPLPPVPKANVPESFCRTVRGCRRRRPTRLTAQWQDEAHAFGQRDLSGTDYVYLWVDGIHLEVRLEQQNLCLLVMIGVHADGRNELVALARRLARIHRPLG